MNGALERLMLKRFGSSLAFVLSVVVLTASTAQAKCPVETLEKLYGLLVHGRMAPDTGDYQETKISDGLLLRRNVKFQVPKGRAPAEGWPVVFIFQGSFVPVHFRRDESAPMGLYYESLLVQKLLKEGFAVIAPEARIGLGWQTNIIPAGAPYELSIDYILLRNILDDLEEGRFGELDKQSLFAVGVSSGGYQSSRMGLAFPGRFKAIAIHSASYATCLGKRCHIPEEMPAHHPPTLLITGAEDPAVPLQTVKNYETALKANGIPVELHVEQHGGHAWFKESPDLILQWFKAYRGQKP